MQNSGERKICEKYLILTLVMFFTLAEAKGN